MIASSSPLPRHASPHFRALPPLALYIHVPWCVRKCPYCDFNSHAVRGALPEREYIAALIADLEQALPRIWGRRVYSVFFGGGTPSLFSADGIAEILSAVRARVPLAADAEITLEANPGTFEAAKFQGYRSAGVNRLSIGIQSFNPRHLKALGRIHDGTEARRAIDSARSTFDNFNLDLMYALPEQTVEEARADLEIALQYAPPHLSAYHLTIEPNTYFHRFPPRVPDDDTSAAMQNMIEAVLSGHGYVHYEVSAFARRERARAAVPKRETPFMAYQPSRAAVCRHNLNYWTFGDYLGIGAGAHSKISFPDRIVREARYRQPKEYMAKAGGGNAVQSGQTIAAADAAFEFMMNALRLTSGFEVRLFTERTGLPFNAVMPALDEAERRGFIVRDHQRIVPTLSGRRFLNDLLQIFLPEQTEVRVPRTAAPETLP